MIRVSDECYNLMQFNTHFLEYATVTLADNTVLNLTPADFTITNNYMIDGAESSVLPLGVAVEKVIQIEIANPAEKYNEYDFYGATIALQLKLQLSNSVETIDKGTFTVIQPVQYGDSIILTAADDMYKADQLITGTITFPITLGSLTSALCTACGITLSSSVFTNSTLSMSTFTGDYTQYTYRQLFGFIAQLAGGNARINTSNQLEFISYDKTALTTMSNMCKGAMSVINTEFPITITFEDDPTSFQDMSIVLYDSTGTTVESWANATLQTYVTDNTLTIPSDATIEAVTDTPCIMEVKWLSAYDGIWHTYRILIPSIKQSTATISALTKWQTLTIETDEVEITGVQTTLTAEQLAQGDDSASDTILSGTDTYVLEVTNPFFNSTNAPTLLANIATIVSGLKVRPFTGEHIANPLIEFMDNVYIVDKRGNVYATVITDSQFTVLGTTALKNSAEPMLRNKQVYYSQADTAYLKAVESADKKVKNVTNYFWHDNAGAHVSTVEGNATSGPNVLVDSTGMDVRDGTTSLAKFGSTARIGKLTEIHLTIDSNGMTISDENDDVLLFLDSINFELLGGDFRIHADQGGRVEFHADNSLNGMDFEDFVRFFNGVQILNDPLLVEKLEFWDDVGPAETSWDNVFRDITINNSTPWGKDADNLPYGHYYIASASEAINDWGTFNDAGHILTFGKYNDTSPRQVQVYWERTANDNIYVRNSRTGTWSQWKQVTVQTEQTTLTSITASGADIPSGSYGGYYTEGKHCYVYVRCRLNSAWSSGGGNVTLFTGLPEPAFTQPVLPVMVANAANGVAWVNDSGNLVIKPETAITTSNFIIINGHYVTA